MDITLDNGYWFETDCQPLVLEGSSVQVGLFYQYLELARMPQPSRSKVENKISRLHQNWGAQLGLAAKKFSNCCQPPKVCKNSAPPTRGGILLQAIKTKTRVQRHAIGLLESRYKKCNNSRLPIDVTKIPVPKTQ